MLPDKRGAPVPVAAEMWVCKPGRHETRFAFPTDTATAHNIIVPISWAKGGNEQHLRTREKERGGVYRLQQAVHENRERLSFAMWLGEGGAGGHRVWVLVGGRVAWADLGSRRGQC